MYSNLVWYNQLLYTNKHSILMLAIFVLHWIHQSLTFFSLCYPINYAYFFKKKSYKLNQSIIYVHSFDFILFIIYFIVSLLKRQTSQIFFPNYSIGLIIQSITKDILILLYKHIWKDNQIFAKKMTTLHYP